MAEAFGIASGALQVADAGLKLAKTLYNYLDGVRKADRELQTLAREVTVTSTTLSSLGRMLEDSSGPSLYTKEMVKEAQIAFKSCEEAFKDVDTAFRSVVRFDNEGKGVTSRGKWAWPLKKGKVEMLQANLERLKTTLSLMLSVVSFAKGRQNRVKSSYSRVAVEKAQIDSLIKAQQDAIARYDELVASFLKLVTSRDEPNAPVARDNPAASVNHITSPVIAYDRSVSGTEEAAGLTQPYDAVHKQLNVCAVAVSRLAQTLERATNEWTLTRDVEYDAIGKSFLNLEKQLERLEMRHQAHSAGPVNASAIGTGGPVSAPAIRTATDDYSSSPNRYSASHSLDHSLYLSGSDLSSTDARLKTRRTFLPSFTRLRSSLIRRALSRQTSNYDRHRSSSDRSYQGRPPRTSADELLEKWTMEYKQWV